MGVSATVSRIGDCVAGVVSVSLPELALDALWVYLLFAILAASALLVQYRRHLKAVRVRAQLHELARCMQSHARRRDRQVAYLSLLHGRVERAEHAVLEAEEEAYYPPPSSPTPALGLSASPRPPSLLAQNGWSASAGTSPGLERFGSLAKKELQLAELRCDEAYWAGKLEETLDCIDHLERQRAHLAAKL